MNNQILNLYNQLRQNPRLVLEQRFNIPQSLDLNNPDSILQHLMNTGQVSQGQVNQVMQMRNSPFIQRLFNNK